MEVNTFPIAIPDIGPDIPAPVEVQEHQHEPVPESEPPTPTTVPSPSKPRTKEPKSASGSSSSPRRTRPAAPPDKLNKKPKKMIHCTVANCSFSARFRKDLVRHYRKHTGEKPYACDKCPKTFSRYDKLLHHTRVHQGIRAYKCSRCEYKCFDSTGLKKHSRVHDNVKPYACQLCSYCTSDPNQLKVHTRFHTGDTPYLCSESNCQKGFKTHTDLKRHLRIHSGEKPYPCSECEYASNVKSNLVTHVKRKHSNVISKESEVPGNCTNANTTNTIAETDLISSIPKPLSLSAPSPSKKCPLPFDVACKLCSFKSCTIRAFKIHMRKAHQVKDYDSHLPIIEETEKPSLVNKKKESGPNTNRNVSSPQAKAYKCPSCSASFVTESSLTCHSRQHKKPQLHPPPAPTIDSMMKYPSKKHLAVLQERLETFGTIEQNTIVSLTQPPFPSPPAINNVQQERPVVIAYAGPSRYIE